MKKILVPCDFSRQSKEAFRSAVDIASKTKGEITVLNMIYAENDPSLIADSSAYDPGLLSIMTRGAKRDFEEMLVEYPHGKIKVNLEIITGSIVDGIKQTLEKLGSDLIVMGTSGASGMREMLIGSNTEKVIRHSPVPVLVVRRALSVDAVQKILLPVTLPFEQVEFIDRVKTLQRFFDAELNVLLVNTESEFITDAEGQKLFKEFKKRFDIADCTFHFRSYHKAEEGIMDFAKQEGMDLVVMGTHARKGLAHLFNGSVTENVVNHIQTPTWTYALD